MSSSVNRAVAIIQCLAEGASRLADLSLQLDLNKSTVHRFLKALVSTGMVAQDPLTRRYYLGPLIIRLAASPIIAHQNLVVCANDEMVRLRDLSRETVVLHVRMGVERICLEQITSPESIRYAVGKGNVEPVYTGSAGKILLAELNDQEIKLLLRSLTLKKLGPHTITDKEQLWAEIRDIREKGFSVSFGERIVDSAAISVPIKQYIVPAALTILGPENRFKQEQMNRILPELRKSAQKIGARLMRMDKAEVQTNAV